MPDPSKHASTAAPPKRARDYGFHVPGMPPVPNFGGESPPKRHKASAKEASPRLTQEMPRRPSSDEERNTPTASGQVAEPMPDHDAAAPDHENLEDAAASASAVLGEEPFVPDWGDSNVQTECAAASNDLESGDQTANQDGLGPNDEDAAAEPPKPFPGSPRSVVYNNQDGLGPNDEDAAAEPPKPFPGFPRSVVYNIARYLGTELIRTNPGIAYYLAQLVDVRAEDQQGPGPGLGASARPQARPPARRREGWCLVQRGLRVVPRRAHSLPLQKMTHVFFFAMTLQSGKIWQTIKSGECYGPHF